MAFFAVAGAAFDREACVLQGAADVACGGVGGEGAVGGGVAGDFGQDFGRPEFGVFRRRKAVEEPCVGFMRPCGEGVTGVAEDDFDLDRAEVELGFALRPCGQERFGHGAGFGEVIEGAGDVGGGAAGRLQSW